VTYIQLRAGTY